MYFKLTNQDLTTHNNFQWKIGKWFRIADEHRDYKLLCTRSWFHCYDSPVMAAILNRRTAGITDPRLFEVNVRGNKISDGTIFGFTMMKLSREIEYPELVIRDLVHMAILCAQYLPQKRPIQELSDKIAKYALLTAKPVDSFRFYCNTEILLELCESLIVKCALSMHILPVIHKYMRSCDRSPFIVS